VKHSKIALAIMAGCAGLTLAGAPTAGAQRDADDSTAAFDQHFVMEAAQGNMFEIGAGRLAAQDGVSGSCKAGRTLATDHTRAQAALKAANKKVDATFPRAPSPVQSWLLTQLSAAAADGGNGGNGANGANAASCGSSSGEASGFDRMWFGLQVAHHLQDLTMYSEAAGMTKSAGLRTYVCKQLPVLRNHLAMLKTAMKDSGISVPTAAAPPRTPSACR
jgi:predicted outer membrane protein